jgi:hypothetical protein
VLVYALSFGCLFGLVGGRFLVDEPSVRASVVIAVLSAPLLGLLLWAATGRDDQVEP